MMTMETTTSWNVEKVQNVEAGNYFGFPNPDSDYPEAPEADGTWIANAVTMGERLTEIVTDWGTWNIPNDQMVLVRTESYENDGGWYTRPYVDR